MLVAIVNAGWVPIYSLNLAVDVPGYIAAPAIAHSYPWTHLISGHMGRLGTRDDVHAAAAVCGRSLRKRQSSAGHRRPDAVFCQIPREQLGRGKAVRAMRWPRQIPPRTDN